MTNAKRTQKEIENDCKKIKEAAMTATSFKELVTLTGLSYAMIKTTLSKHPIISNRIKSQLAINKQNVELGEQKVEKFEIKAEPVAEDEENIELQKVTFPAFVIDASITGIENLRDIISKICTTRAKIVLTSITN